MVVLGLILLAAAVVAAVEAILANTAPVTVHMWGWTWHMDLFWVAVCGAGILFVGLLGLWLMTSGTSRAWRVRRERRALARENVRLAAAAEAGAAEHEAAAAGERRAAAHAARRSEARAAENRAADKATVAPAATAAPAAPRGAYPPAGPGYGPAGQPVAQPGAQQVAQPMAPPADPAEGAGEHQSVLGRVLHRR